MSSVAKTKMLYYRVSPMPGKTCPSKNKECVEVVVPPNYKKKNSRSPEYNFLPQPNRTVLVCWRMAPYCARKGAQATLHTHLSRALPISNMRCVNGPVACWVSLTCYFAKRTVHIFVCFIGMDGFVCSVLCFSWTSCFINAWGH